MTTISNERVVCGACGTVRERSVVTSTNSYGYNDLDLRPPEMVRSCIDLEIEYCPACGYASNDLSKLPEQLQVLHSSGYRSILRHRWLTPVAKAYLCHAQLLQAESKLAMAVQATIKAAWVCDDWGYRPGSYNYRMQAVKLISGLHTEGQQFTETMATDMLLVTDLLRRSGEFCKAEEAATLGLCLEPDEDIGKALDYELFLIHERNRSARTFKEALGIEDENPDDLAGSWDF